MAFLKIRPSSILILAILGIATWRHFTIFDINLESGLVGHHAPKADANETKASKLRHQVNATSISTATRKRGAGTSDDGNVSERQRIVILAGPHKTASTTLQEFFSGLAGSYVPVRNGTDPKAREGLQRPYWGNADWVWPIGVEEDYDGRDEPPVSVVPFRTPHHPRKFYAILASYISGRRMGYFFPRWDDGDENDGEECSERNAEIRRGIRDYFRSLFRRPWGEGKNLVIGAEAFDSVLLHLRRKGDLDHREDNGVEDRGEELHVSPYSDKMIDNLLDVFPWQDNISLPSSLTSSIPALRLEDIEVHVNFRTPRISHVVSIWHQFGGKSTLRTFLAGNGSSNLYMLNSLSQALQFVRKGIPTTIVDMEGVNEKEEREREVNESEPPTRLLDKEGNRRNRKKQKEGNGINETVVVGGLQGVVGCEILRMDNLCDASSKLHLPGYKISVGDMNLKNDKSDTCLTDQQMKEIDLLLNAYDCGVWQHLRKYQEQGLLRIFHPSKNLFSTCAPERDENISFYDMLQRMKEILLRENGIPLSRKEKQLGKRDNNINHSCFISALRA